MRGGRKWERIQAYFLLRQEGELARVRVFVDGIDLLPWGSLG